jgi:hypothetical protein
MFNGVKLCLCVLEGCASTPKQGHNTLALRRFLGQRLLQPALLPCHS